MAYEDEVNVEYNDNNVPTDSENYYATKISDYFYGKLNRLEDDDFTEQDIIDYQLEDIVTNDGKFNISTTKKLIRYLKSFVKLYLKDKVDASEYDSDLQSTQSDIRSLRNDVNNVCNLIYPVGSIYMSITDTDPSILFGGTWVKLENHFLLGSGTRTVGSYGGEEEHELTVSEMPKHTHTQNPHNHSQNAHNHGSGGSYRFLSSNANVVIDSVRRALGSIPKNSSGNRLVYSSGLVSGVGIDETQTTGNATPYINPTTVINNDTGESKAHNNMPPYFVVHMWRRES